MMNNLLTKVTWTLRSESHPRLRTAEDGVWGLGDRNAYLNEKRDVSLREHEIGMADINSILFRRKSSHNAE